MAAVNNITREVSPKSMFEDATNVISASSTWDQGDLLVFDDTNNVIIRAANEEANATFLGVAVQSVTAGKIASPYQGTAVDAAQAIAPVKGPVFGVICKLTLKTGDAFNPGDLVYWSANQTISSAGTKAIGLYQGGVVASAVAGQQGEALIGCRHPGDVLKF